MLAAALHDAGDLAFEGPGVGAAGDDELHAVAVQSIQRIALADIYVVSNSSERIYIAPVEIICTMPS